MFIIIHILLKILRGCPTVTQSHFSVVGSIHSISRQRWACYSWPVAEVTEPGMHTAQVVSSQTRSPGAVLTGVLVSSASRPSISAAGPQGAGRRAGAGPEGGLRRGLVRRAGPGAAAGGCRRCRSPLELQVELCRRAASRKPHGPSSAWPRRRLPGCSVEWPGADGGGAAAGGAAGGRPAKSAAGKAAALPAERTRRPGLRGAARRGVDFLRAGQDSAGPWPRRPRLR